MDSDYPFGIFKLFLQLTDQIERMKQHCKLWGILFVEYLLLYYVTLILNKSRVIKRCSIDVAIFVRLQEINEKVNITFGAHDVVQE
jgi:hypothetical protein